MVDLETFIVRFQLGQSEYEWIRVLLRWYLSINFKAKNL